VARSKKGKSWLGLAVVVVIVVAAIAGYRGGRKPLEKSSAPPRPLGVVAQEVAQVVAGSSKEQDAATIKEPRVKIKVHSKHPMNHLAGQKSPYLLQHVRNPVDWYPWGEEAFAKARAEEKPIFLSIGYSTCHWCHVMERESFTHEKIAAFLNKHFVSIKVDREERPDIDKIYMTAAQGAGWGGGWPLSVWLTPDLKPFFGGTYFPPDSQYGRPGFMQILERIADVWREKREAVTADAERLAAALKNNTRISGREAEFQAAWLKGAYRSYADDFDATSGGFGGRPKFPMPVNQNFLLRYFARANERKALDITHKTLAAMSAGGIYDHVGGGFARYSVDDQWRIPHFEKMLYDNAQLSVNLLEAYQATKDPALAQTARETLDYVLRDMTHSEGGFFSAEDADSLPVELAGRVDDAGHAHKTEGAFYLWSSKELAEVLKEDAELFAFYYGVAAGGNALEDPHHEFDGKNILYQARSLKEAADKFSISESAARRRLKAARQTLLAVRAKRPRPGLDDKVLASWNGLMLSGLAKGAQVLEDERYREAAEKAAGFLRKRLYDEKTKVLYHRWREGERAIPGQADDYAFLAQGLLDLYEASFDPTWLDWAIELGDALLANFYDTEGGGFFMTAEGNSPHLLTRIIEDSDNVEPAASSVAALTLLRLGHVAHRNDFREAAEKTIHRFGRQLEKAPRSMPQMLVAADFAAAKPRQVILAGELDDPATREMLRMVHARFQPGRMLMVVTPASRKRLAKRLSILRGMVPIDGKTTAYICENFACELPTNDLQTVARLLDGDK
jgi:uncharacterized protein YyaL (SSP411 family)